MGPLKRDFLDIYLTTFSESVISEIKNLWGSSFFLKDSKFHAAIRNSEKNENKFFIAEIIAPELLSLNFPY